jgi:hypothetical protein
MKTLSIVCLSLVLLSSSVPLGALNLPTNQPVLPSSDSVDIPTWYPGDTWVYDINPFEFSSENGSFTGSVTDCYFTVTGVHDDTYTLWVSAAIQGVFSGSGMEGDVDGIITGTSTMRRSDIAQCSTDLTSSGTVIIIILPFSYTAALTFSSTPSLEAFDFPLTIGNTWQVQTQSTTTGWFNVQNMMNQSLDGIQTVDETVTCPQHASITVPAGTFDCYEVTRASSDAWYSDEVGNLVKSTISQNDENGTVNAVLALQSFTRSIQPVQVTETIQPAAVWPGDHVVVSGRCNINDAIVIGGNITVEIPSTGNVYTTTTDTNGDYSLNITAPTILDDTPSNHEAGSSGVVVTCEKDGLVGYCVKTLTTIANTEPDVPVITGPSQGKPKVTYIFNLTSTDAENDTITYLIDWGDSSLPDVIGPVPSGVTVSAYHAFTKKGTYSVRAQAKDAYNAESEWSTLQVKMPYIPSHPILDWLFEHFPHAFPLLRRLLPS